MIFLRVLPKNFLWPHYSGVPGACGLRFIEPPEPPVPTPLCELQYTLVIAHGLITLCPSSVQRPSTGFDSFDEFADHSTTNRQPYWFTPSLRPGSTIAICCWPEQQSLLPTSCSGSWTLQRELWAARRGTTAAWHTCFDTLSYIGSMWQIE